MVPPVAHEAELQEVEALPVERGEAGEEQPPLPPEMTTMLQRQRWAARQPEPQQLRQTDKQTPTPRQTHNQTRPPARARHGL